MTKITTKSFDYQVVQGKLKQMLKMLTKNQRNDPIINHPANLAV